MNAHCAKYEHHLLENEREVCVTSRKKVYLSLTFDSKSNHYQKMKEEYCKSGNFRENFIFANSVIRHICDV